MTIAEELREQSISEGAVKTALTCSNLRFFKLHCPFCHKSERMYWQEVRSVCLAMGHAKLEAIK